MARPGIFVALIAALALGPPAARAQAQTTAAQTIVQPAADGIFEAFRTHPLVGLSDDHGLAQAMDFYAAIIRDPRFARDVGNIVVEFGASGRQSVIDRYVAGESVPYTELRTVWTDTVGWIPTAGYLGFARFFAAVREVNKTLPPARRIRVWLGEPAIDWSAPTRPDLMAAMSARDSHPAQVINEEILAHGKKALVIYGAYHFGSGQWLRGRVESAHPGAFFIVLPYGRLHHPAACAPLLDRATRGFPALAEPADPSTRECFTLSGPASGGAPSPSLTADAVLLYGRLETLGRGPFLPDYALDDDYRREVARRSQLGGPPLIRFPAGLSLRRADYNVDLDAPGFAQRIDAMFAAYDSNRDGVVTAEEYVDPIPQ